MKLSPSRHELTPLKAHAYYSNKLISKLVDRVD